jgi:SAM-dependent methyltransferase
LSEERLATLAAGYYEVDFAGSSIGEKFAKVMAMPPSQSDNFRRVERVLAFIDAWNVAGQRRAAGLPLRVMDIGAGTGVYLAKLGDLAPAKDVLIDAIAVEPDPDAARHLRSLGRFQVIEGLYTTDIATMDRDLVSLNKVLEHLVDPLTLLKDAAKALAEPGGVLYIEVPDVMTIGRRPSSDNILGPLHRHLYSPTSVQMLAARAGLVLLQMSRVFEPSGKISIGAFAVSASTLEQMCQRGGA